MEEDEMSRAHVSLEELEEAQGEINSSNAKRLKLLEEDRISSLPDAIILHILSCLPTEDAVRTGLLSRRWKYLWIYVPNLVFSYEGSGKDLDEFYEFISKTLALHFSQKINKWSFSLSLDSSDNLDLVEIYKMESIVSLGLRFATIRRMEELRLDLFRDLFYEMPTFIYGHSSLTKLFARSCYFPLFRGQVSWGLLKELSISETTFKEGVFQKILLGSPLLEQLKLKCCIDVPNFDTASNVRLKRLVLDRTLGCAPKGDLEISIPTVTSLKILGFCYLTEFRLLNVSSLLDVTLDFTLDHHILSDQGLSLPTCCDYVWQLLERLNHVKKLTVGIWCIQVLSVAMAQSLRPPLSKKNCSCLTLPICFEERDAPGVASLLQSTPYLEKLVVHSEIRRSSSLKLDNVDFHIATDYWTSQTGSFHCLQSLLKTVQIVGLEPESYLNELLIYDNDRLLEFIKFLLRSAKVLEKLVILAPSDPYWKMEDYSSISQQLLSFPRSSAQAVVLLHK